MQLWLKLNCKPVIDALYITELGYLSSGEIVDLALGTATSISSLLRLVEECDVGGLDACCSICGHGRAWRDARSRTMAVAQVALVQQFQEFFC
ncbi:hypothetical protein C0J52_05952 [Blattella germanica]|nr:hypothetical protein C0J52_05952 [Blattella germanica]